MKPIIPTISQDSVTLAHHLRTIAPGTSCPYAELTTLIRRNVQKEARGCLDTARRMLQREERIVFAPIRGVGLVRLTDSQITHTGTETLLRIRRASRRGVKRLTCIQDFNALENADKLRHNAALAVLGVFYEVSKTNNVRKIEGIVGAFEQHLSLRETLQAFINNADSFT